MKQPVKRFTVTASLAVQSIFAALALTPHAVRAQVFSPLTIDERYHIARTAHKAIVETAIREAVSRRARFIRDSLRSQLRPTTYADGVENARLSARRDSARSVLQSLVMAFHDSAFTSQEDSSLPPPQLPKPKLVQVFGVGSLNIKELAEDPSARLMLNAAFLKRTSAFFSFNRGAGLTKVNADSFKIGSIVFPEAGNSGFLMSLTAPVEWVGYPFRKVRAFRSTQDWLTAWNQSAVSWSASAFTELSIQNRSAERRLISGSDTITKAYAFDVVTTNVGIKIQAAYYDQVSAEEGNSLRLIGGLSWANLGVTPSTTDDYRALFDAAVTPGSVLPSRFYGPTAKITAALNGIAFEAEFQALRSAGGGPRVKGVTDGRFIVRTTLASTMLAF